jgi:hypothetical protein
MQMFKSIDGFENYEVSEMGEIRNSKTGRILKPCNQRGYLDVGLRKNGKKTTMYIHRLVASTFLDNPNNLREVDHINNIKNDNRLVNLKWVTSSENKQNTPTRKTNKTGVKGVFFDKHVGKYKAEICIDGIQIRLGTFDNLDDARNARIAKVYEVFTNVNQCEKM